MRERLQLRASTKSRYWHVGLCALATAGIFGFVDYIHFNSTGVLPTLKNIWWVSAVLPLSCGAVVTLGCGGAKIWKRIIAAVICGIVTAIFYTAISTAIGYDGQLDISPMITPLIWRLFVFTVLSGFGAVLGELR